MSWAGDVGLEEVLAAADRLRRAREGQDLPAWGEPERPAKGESGRLNQDPPVGRRACRARASPADDPAGRVPASQNPANRDPADKDPADDDPSTQDPLGEDELRAAEADAGQPMLSSEMAGTFASRRDRLWQRG